MGFILRLHKNSVYKGKSMGSMKKIVNGFLKPLCGVKGFILFKTACSPYSIPGGGGGTQDNACYICSLHLGWLKIGWNAENFGFDG